MKIIKVKCDDTDEINIISSYLILTRSILINTLWGFLEGDLSSYQDTAMALGLTDKSHPALEAVC